MNARPTALTTVAGLVQAGLAPVADSETLAQVAEQFRVRLTPEMQGAIAAVDDAVARQFLPMAAELNIRPEERADPIGDRAHMPVPGLTHRYPDRAILAVTQSCAVYCRFCFRRETVGDSGALPDAALIAAYEYLRKTPAVREVILTGGDPMMLSPRRLGAILAALSDIPHLEVIRLHTRIPVVDPERITAQMVAALDVAKTVYVAIHTNHAQELTPGAAAAIARLTLAGVPLVAQTVLLRGVNDTVEALEALFRALIRLRVKPYYLHHCDLAQGTSHFRTTIAAGQALMAALRGRVSSLCLPTYVLDVPGGFGKMQLNADYVSLQPDGSYLIRDYQGGLHSYRDPD
ncbi:MAG: lysine-2,3-aminomutase-like protein [Paracoccaceae bacterium]